MPIDHQKNLEFVYYLPSLLFIASQRELLASFHYVDVLFNKIEILSSAGYGLLISFVLLNSGKYQEAGVSAGCPE